MDRTVLSYHDTLLKQSDVSLLEGSNWLNDKIIGFYFEYVQFAVVSLASPTLHEESVNWRYNECD